MFLLKFLTPKNIMFAIILGLGIFIFSQDSKIDQLKTDMLVKVTAYNELQLNYTNITGDLNQLKADVAGIQDLNKNLEQNLTDVTDILKVSKSNNSDLQARINSSVVSNECQESVDWLRSYAIKRER